MGKDKKKQQQSKQTSQQSSAQQSSTTTNATTNDTNKQTNMKNNNSKDEGKYFELEGAIDGQVVVRFPPEASGYLHIGHAKAALLNAHYQQAYHGKLVFRFDDTNPEKEKESFEKIIEGDVELLGIKPDRKTYTSDYFDLMMAKAEEMIRSGMAYVDDTDPEQMKKEREERIESKNRTNSVEKNLEMWKEIVAGSAKGQSYCLRAKIDMKSDNGAMRDPTIYRCKLQEHPRTGNKYRAYPTYDFACPIVDSIEGITHALRTSEYMDRDAQYYWFCDALKIRKPLIAAYSRLNLMHTVLSKRKLTYFVEEGLVEGWDDPRMPTVRGILRRGLTVEGLKMFIAAQGSSKAVVVMDWDKIWSFNRKVIDMDSPRYSAVEQENSVPVIIEDTEFEPNATISAALHPKNPELGQRAIPIGKQLLIDQQDAQLLKPDTAVTFVQWGNLRITSIERNGDLVTAIKAKLDLDNKDFKKTVKVTWLEDTNKIPARLVYYDNIIKKPVLGKDDDFKEYLNLDSKMTIEAYVDGELSKLPKGKIIQIQRKGFFICDRIFDESAIDFCGKPAPVHLISIPDGSTDLNIFPKRVQDWKKRNVWIEPPPPPTAAAATKNSKESSVLSLVDLDQNIRKQGDSIRALKASKSDKDTIKAEVDKLLALKNQFKQQSGKDWSADWKPDTSTAPCSNSGDDLNRKIREQGDLIRKLKAEKADKKQIDEQVQLLLKLKANFKEVTGQDWKPDAPAAAAATTSNQCNDNGKDLDRQIREQGDKIRKMKADKADKQQLENEIQILLKLKNDYKQQTGKDWKPDQPTAIGGNQSSKQQASSSNKDKKESMNKSKSKETNKENKNPQQQQQKQQPQQPKQDSKVKKQTRLGIETKKSENYSEWYTEVITKAEMIEYYDVSGCYILRPWSYSIWEKIQQYFDHRIKRLGVQNCYFPMFISKSALETEKTHIADFAPEVAWVTKSGSSDLAEPIAIRPTSETVMYPSYGKWVQSYRDLPIRLNQWCSVVRWEFKQPTPFLRTREFLWQEGHSAFADEKQTLEEVYEILNYYADVYEKLLAIPVVKGRKTEKEKFAGGELTTTCEAYVHVNGRGIQGATSHYLGQNFSKMFEIVFEDPDKPGQKCYAHQCSWGISTRTIGALIMIHGDDKGLVLPPRVACKQVVIVPCGITATIAPDEKEKLLKTCRMFYEKLTNENGISVELDDRDHYSPGWKFNHWELKGVPLRIELGPKDLQQGKFVTVRRDNGEKNVHDISQITQIIPELLEKIQKDMFENARKLLNDNTCITEDWNEFLQRLDMKSIIMSPFCGRPECEDQIKKDSAKDDVQEQGSGGSPLMGAKSLCIPLEQPKQLSPNQLCIHPQCKQLAKFYTLFGRSY